MVKPTTSISATPNGTPRAAAATAVIPLPPLASAPALPGLPTPPPGGDQFAGLDDDDGELPF